MSALSSPPQRATVCFPFAYRLILTTIEPVFAALGAVQAVFGPSLYLKTLTRDSVAFETGTSFLYTELAGAWLVFAFNEAVVLRLFDDRRLWTALVWGMLLSDVAYCHSCAQAVGGWSRWAVLADWTVEDWVVFVTTAPMVMTRVLIALGIGVREDKGKRREKEL